MNLKLLTPVKQVEYLEDLHERRVRLTDDLTKGWEMNGSAVLVAPVEFVEMTDEQGVRTCGRPMLVVGGKRDELNVQVLVLCYFDSMGHLTVLKAATHLMEVYDPERHDAWQKRARAEHETPQAASRRRVREALGALSSLSGSDVPSALHAAVATMAGALQSVLAAEPPSVN